MRVTSANANATVSNFDVVTITGTTSYNGTFTIFNVDATGFSIRDTYVADEAPVGAAWQKNGGLIGGCSTTGATGAITLAYLPARIVGVAPLSMFFDATTTTASATLRPFHDLEYRWNFGDAGSGTWATGSGAGANSRNTQVGGGVAAHVFDAPGVYTVTLTVFDGANTASNNCLQIAVQDPEVVFGGSATGGSNTVCVSTSSAFTGCPTGAAQVTPANFTTAIGNISASAKRLLFRCGDTWTASGATSIGVAGPGIVGAYNNSGMVTAANAACTKPVVDMGAAGFSVLRWSSPSVVIADWRIADIRFDGQLNATGNIITGGQTGTDQLLMLRLDIVDAPFATQFAVSSVLDHIYDQISFVDGTISGTQIGNQMFWQGTRLALLGSSVTGSDANQVRWQYAGKGIASNNTLSNADAGVSNLTVRGVNVAGIGGGVVPAGTFTQDVVLSDNLLTANPAGQAYPLSVETQNVSSNENIRRVIIERNWIRHGGGATPTNLLKIESASQVTVRNNILQATAGGAGGKTMVVISHDNTAGAAAPDRTEVYNNTLFMSATSDFTGVNVTAAVSPPTNTMLKNNLGYAPNANPGHVMIVNAGSGTVGASGTFGNTLDVTTNPNFVAVAPTQPADYRPTGYPVNAGVAVPVWSDFFRAARAGTPDTGAVNP